MIQQLAIIIFAAVLAVIGFALMAFSEPGDYRSGMLGLVIALSAIPIAAYGLERQR